VPNALERVRQAARKDKKLRFTALLHHIYNLETLRMAYFRLKKEASPGVDGETWRSYGEQLELHLQKLCERLKQGAYRAKPVRRVYIPKADGRQRPLGVTALEDKIVQRATVEVLNTIYETDFLGFSYGFRPKRSQHQALDALYTGLLTRKVSWVLDLDIRSFFDKISHEWLVKFIRWIPGKSGCQAVLGRTDGTDAEIRPRTASRENAPTGVRTICDPGPPAAWRRET
jgi:RNA-directed DNA polymerase